MKNALQANGFRIGLLIRNNSILFFLAVAILASMAFVPNFLTVFNIKNFFLQASDLLVVACGLTFVVLNGGIDFSVTSVLALGSVVGAYIMALSPLASSPAISIPLAILTMIAIGALVGTINGLSLTLLKIPSFITTLAMQLVFSGVAILFTSKVAPRASIGGLPEAFFFFGGDGPYFLVPILITAGVFLFSHWLLQYTVFGRRVLAVGTNPKAAHVSGIPVKRTIFTLCLLSGLYAGIASVLATSRNQAGIASLGDKMFISIIASIVIGGTSIAGGAGGFKQTLLGVLFITLINNTMNLLGIEWYITMLFQGVLILVAAFSDYLVRVRRSVRKVQS